MGILAIADGKTSFNRRTFPEFHPGGNGRTAQPRFARPDPHRPMRCLGAGRLPPCLMRYARAANPCVCLTDASGAWPGIITRAI